jgi:hypothetical protein
MALETAQVAVSTTRVELTNRPASDPSNSLAVHCTADLFVGDSGVTAANGFLVPAGSTLTLDLQSGERVYGILASGAGTAYVLRTGLG